MSKNIDKLMEKHETKNPYFAMVQEAQEKGTWKKGAKKGVSALVPISHAEIIERLARASGSRALYLRTALKLGVILLEKQLNGSVIEFPEVTPNGQALPAKDGGVLNTLFLGVNTFRR